MNRRPKRSLDNKNKEKVNMYISLGIIIVAVTAFILAYTLYGKKLSEQSPVADADKIAKTKNTVLLNGVTNEEVSEVSQSIGKSVNEIEQNDEENNTIEKRAVNTSNIEKEVIEERNNIANEEDKKEDEDEGNNTNETSQPLTFVRPVDGEVLKDYSADNLIYSNTLEEWTTHLGIDYKAEKTSIVKAAADGTIKTIKNDPRYGLTVVIEHSDGFTTMYANLLSTEFITVGETVKQGQTIATVGNTATFEIADETHLHFEILKDNKSVDPNMYIQ